MSKYRNIPQATKDNVLHYINQVYDEAYELGYQRGRVQSDKDIENAQQMIEAAIKNLHELKQEPKRGKWEKVPYKRQGHDEIVIDREAWRCTNCGNAPKINNPYMRYCPNCGARMESDAE